MAHTFIKTLVLLCAFSMPANAFSKKAPAPAPSPSPTAKPSPKPSPTPSPKPSATPSPTPSPTAAPSPTIYKVTFATDPSMSAAEKAKFLSAGKKMNEVIQSQCFHDFIANRALIQTNGRTPAQVADHLQSLTGVIPAHTYYACMHFSISSCWSPTSAVAYRQPPDLDIYLNDAYFSTSDSDCTWAATLGHESVGHSLGGYDHDYDWSPSRSFSVPYSIGGADDGDAFTKCCK